MNDTFLLDPTEEEERHADANSDTRNSYVAIGYMPSLQQVCAYTHGGISEAESLDRIMELLVEHCLKVQPIVQNCLKESIEKELVSSDEKNTTNDAKS